MSIADEIKAARDEQAARQVASVMCDALRAFMKHILEDKEIEPIIKHMKQSGMFESEQCRDTFHGIYDAIQLAQKEMGLKV